MCRIAPALVLLSLFAAPTASAWECHFVKTNKIMKLVNDCVTSSTITIPDGFTLDGDGHLITVIDPDPASGKFFNAPIITNAAGAQNADVRNVIVDSPNLVPDLGDFTCNNVFGILLQNVSGSITDTTLLHIGRAVTACIFSNGVGIQVQNFTSTHHHVRIEHNKVLLANGVGIQIAGAAENDGQALSADILENELSNGNGSGSGSPNLSTVISFFALDGGTIRGNLIDVGSEIQSNRGIVIGDQNQLRGIKVLANNINLVSGVVAFQGIGIQINTSGNEVRHNRVFSFGAIDAETEGIGISDQSGNPAGNQVTHNEVRCYVTPFQVLAGGVDLSKDNTVLPCPF